MKETSQKIFNWFNSENIENQLNLFKTNSPNYSASETTINEAYDEIEYVKQLIVAAIENDVFDKLTFHKRNQINSHLINISNYLNQLSRWNFTTNNPQANSQANAFISSALALRDIIDSTFLGEKLKGYYKYSEQTKELNKIKRRYNNLVKAISNSETISREVIGTSEIIKEQSDSLLNKIKELETTSKSTLNLKSQIETLYNQINSNAQDIDAKKIEINSIHKNSENIETTFESTETKLKEIKDNSEADLKEFYNTKETEYTTKVIEFDKKATEIIEKNTDLQKKINVLLEGTNAGRLYKSFHWRKKQIEKHLWFWLVGIAIINILIVVLTVLIINGSEKLGLAELSTNGIDSAFYMKLLISIPLIFLDVFFISQYNSRKDLIEKYSFKSVLSLSILAYNEMLRENQDNKISQDFIIETVERIYESPFEQKRLSKKELDILNNLAKTGLEHLDNVSQGMIKKVIE